MPNKPTVIVTGFKPFGSYQHNPTQDCVEYLNTIQCESACIIGIVLKCTYKGAFAILQEHIAASNPQAIVQIGLSSSVPSIQIETKATNCMWHSTYADADGLQPDHEQLLVDGLDTYTLNSDALHLQSALQSNGIPACTSANAHTFICNSLMYLTAAHIARLQLPIKHAFIHIPWTDVYERYIEDAPEKITIPEVKLWKAVDVLVEELLRM